RSLFCFELYQNQKLYLLLLRRNQPLPVIHDISLLISAMLLKGYNRDEDKFLQVCHFQLLLHLILVEKHEWQQYIRLSPRLKQLSHILLSYTSSSDYKMILVYFNWFFFFKDS